ncbi:RNA degradosome polyphosphate kinase [Bifidobacterium longum subsp. infantis]|uniref:Polyphosphate kinase n=1 Tax=Bifidobacterium longum subsp. infantis TaxID=1682 RepID=A0A7D4XY24_BIFLI|nr:MULTISPECIES: RNA degradosome polyphosphate kinase [Bifidobacterium]KAB1944438.1 RNA degradosome polyphosphate kinase [Bifidobacterium longum subsp. infantis]KEY30723.1 polyphosphate kinase [Bifidobacterium longum subsp. infantis EK3]MED7620092.1 RNA degradosome polyphosphate kinase [Bifidobacterium longum subsp. infantis]NQX51493.1 RNA degradosome polyphosphate kinase [Bifidobacterium longum subsp. infantis]QKY14183.1 RNA degradosome polyphosphate kinase [Bifidobacterium longum subsp. infa
MAQIFDAPSKAILRSQIAEHIAENDNNDRRVDQEGEAPLPKDRFFDRELSWLKFNQRVLECAENEDMPLLERANFAAIFASNLDEFFMVRVAGLKRRIDSGIAVPSAAGLSPRQQLRAISETAHRLQDEHAHYAIDTILPELEKERIVLLTWDKLTSSEQERLSRYYRQQVFPVLTPLAVDPAHPFPYISGGSINLAVIVENPASGKSHFARVKIPGNLPRLVPVDDMTDEESKDERYGFIAMEKLIAAHLESLFPGMIIKEACSFRVTRNEDIDVEEDDAENLLNAMEKELLRRRFGPPIRLEITDTTSPFLSQLLADQLGVSQDEVYRLPSPLDLTVLFELGSVDRPDLKNRPFVPTTNRQIAEVESSRAQDIFAAIRERDILLHHPYDSFSTSVQAFLAQAAADPKVLAIKQTLYRTSSNSPIIDALIDAAHAGKQVLALVEIKARFDEDANIAWARKLERAGVHVVYGIVGLKTHCKLIEVVRQEADGLRRYCHVGTGNYNPKTARLYTDLGLLTCDPVVGQDLTRLFNQLSGYAPKSSFHRLLVAPRTVRTGLIQRIRREEDAARAGKEAWIKIKVNSIVDEKTIDALYRASQAGVKIDIVERGICALKPGVPGLSENIRVRSILGRFLEHSRIYAFCNADGPQIGEGPASGPEVYIGSADLMHRNLDRRVEALVRVTAPEQIDGLIKYVDLQMADSTMSWHMQPDGTYVLHTKDDEGRPLVDSQEYLIRKHQRRPNSHN